MRKLNILVIPTWYPSGADKIMGIYHKDFCSALSNASDVKVNMLYVDRQRLNNPLKYVFMPKREVIDEESYKVYKYKMLNYQKISAKFQLKMYTKKLEKALLDYLKYNPKPDVLHAQVTIPAGYAASKLGKKYNIPVVVTEHSSYFERFFTGDNKIYGDYVIKNAYFTTVSQYMKEKMLKITKQCDILPNLVNTSIFNTKKKKRKKTLQLVTVSALRQGKRIDDIIKAVKVLVNDKKFNNVHLNIIGDGFLMEQYKTICNQLDMNKYVTFHGKKTKEEIADFLREQDIFIIGSEIETFCIPGIEALASGIPVVSTRCNGPEEYIDKKCGQLCDIGDYKGMAEAILDVYNRLDKYDINYLKKVAEKFSSDSVTKKARKIYKSILKNKKEI